MCISVCQDAESCVYFSVPRRRVMCVFQCAKTPSHVCISVCQDAESCVYFSVPRRRVMCVFQCAKTPSHLCISVCQDAESCVYQYREEVTRASLLASLHTLKEHKHRLLTYYLVIVIYSTRELRINANMCGNA